MLRSAAIIGDFGPEAAGEPGGSLQLSGWGKALGNLFAVRPGRSRLRGTIMIGMFSLVSVLLGASLAYAADHVPARVELLESSGGALLIAGLALLGSALPFTPH